ncbi:MAG: glycerophosphodiester phosphodiesterase family protein [Porphyromonadaceae bacterium]|nr:glycerophosphodiester phosphodiesterase family protein [Porphyromonadaceae bacterium]
MKAITKNLKMKKTFFVIISCLLFLQNSIAQKIQDNVCNPEIMVVAHRGAHNNFPENSIPAIREATELGVDFIEIDIRHTKDSSLVLMHDDSIDRTTNGHGLVEDYTLQEIKNFRLKNADGSLSDEQIPTFEEILTQFGNVAHFDLDIKTSKKMRVVEMMEKYNLLESSLFLIYDLQFAKMLKNRDDRFRILIRAKNEESLKDIYNDDFLPEAVHIDDSFDTVSTNNTIKKMGSRSFINSLGDIDKEAVNNPEAFEKAYDNGANIIQTNYPELLLRHLRSKGLHR